MVVLGCAAVSYEQSTSVIPNAERRIRQPVCAKPQTPNPKPQTPNFKPRIPNAKPQTLIQLIQQTPNPFQAGLIVNPKRCTQRLPSSPDAEGYSRTLIATPGNTPFITNAARNTRQPVCAGAYKHSSTAVSYGDTLSHERGSHVIPKRNTRQPACACPRRTRFLMSEVPL